MKDLHILAIIAIFLCSCGGIEVETGGCIDPYAYNYESIADYDDGSCLYACDDPYSTNYDVLLPVYICEYEADVVFYEDVDAAIYFDNQGIDYLDVYVGNDYVGTLQANLGFTYVPLCYPIDADAVHFTLIWENSQSSTFNWSVRDGSGFIHYSGADVILANNCLPMELTFKKIQEYKEANK
jgi:hypothetical protein